MATVEFQSLPRKIGKSPSYVSRRISLLKLPKEIQEQLLRQRKNASIAQELFSSDAQGKKRLTNFLLSQKVCLLKYLVIYPAMQQHSLLHLYVLQGLVQSQPPSPLQQHPSVAGRL